MNNPEKLFTRQLDGNAIDAENPELLKQHLICAAYEVRLSYSVTVFSLYLLLTLVHYSLLLFLLFAILFMRTMVVVAFDDYC